MCKARSSVSSSDPESPIGSTDDRSSVVSSIGTPPRRLPSFEGALAPGAQATAVYRFKEMQAGPAELVIRWEPADRSIAADDFEFAFRIP